MGQEPHEETLTLGPDGPARRRVPRLPVRRRTAAVTAVAVVAALAVWGVVQDKGARPSPVPGRELDLDDAVPYSPEVLASVRERSAGHSAGETYDRFVGLTDDGLAVRVRRIRDEPEVEVGLHDPASRRTDWLPRPPWDLHDAAPVALATDDLVFWTRWNARHALLAFDRASRTWTRRPVVVPAGSTGPVLGVLTELGADGRLYLFDGAPHSWWSVPFPAGGRARPEPALQDHWLAGDGTTSAVVGPDRRIALSAEGSVREVAAAPPPGCTAVEALAPFVELAGTTVLVTWSCTQGTWLAAHDDEGNPLLTVRGDPGLRVSAATQGRALLEAGSPHSGAGTDSHAYLLDLVAGTIRELGPAGHQLVSDLEDDLVLWSPPGPRDDGDTLDVVYRVARVP